MKKDAKRMIHNNAFLRDLVHAIEQYQLEYLLSDDQLSRKMWLSASVIWKIKSWKTKPSYTTLRKLKKWWIVIPASKVKNKFSKKHTTKYNKHDPP